MSIPKYLQLFFVPAIVPGLLCLAGQVHGHGVRGTTSTAKAICAAVMYDSGDPMSYGAVEILAPDSEFSFQTGRTDRNGFFCFFPDSEGEYKLVIDDEMGHQVRLKVSVDEDTNLAQVLPGQDHDVFIMNRINGTVSGIALIFGFGGFFAWWRSRRDFRFKQGMENSAEEVAG